MNKAKITEELWNHPQTKDTKPISAKEKFIGVYLGHDCEEVRLPLEDRPNFLLLKIEKAKSNA